MEFLNNGFLGFIIWLNKFFNDFGVSLIFFTIILKIVLAPLDFLTFLEEEKLKRIRPKINETLKKYKNDIQKQAEVLNNIYKEEKYNPFFTLLIQFLPLPIIFSVFFVLNNIVKSGDFNLIFLQSIDLRQKNFFLVLIVALLQFLTIKNIPQEQRKMILFFYGLIIFTLAQFPAIFNLYWMVNLVLTLLERNFFRFYQIKLAVPSVPKNDS